MKGGSGQDNGARYEGRLRAAQRSQVGRRAQGWTTEPVRKEGSGLHNGARKEWRLNAEQRSQGKKGASGLDNGTSSKAHNLTTEPGALV